MTIEAKERSKWNKLGKQANNPYSKKFLPFMQELKLQLKLQGGIKLLDVLNTEIPRKVNKVAQ